MNSCCFNFWLLSLKLFLSLYDGHLTNPLKSGWTKWHEIWNECGKNIMKNIEKWTFFDLTTQTGSKLIEKFWFSLVLFTCFLADNFRNPVSMAALGTPSKLYFIYWTNHHSKIHSVLLMLDQLSFALILHCSAVRGRLLQESGILFSWLDPNSNLLIIVYLCIKMI